MALVEIDYTTRVRATYDIPDNIANLKDFETWFFENYDAPFVQSWIKEIYDDDFEYNYIEKHT